MLCHYTRKHFRAKKHAQNSNLKTRLKKQPGKAIFQCCSLTEKDEKSELKCIWKEFKKAAPAPRNAITRSAIIASIFDQNSPEFKPLLVLFLASFLKTHCRRRCQKCSATTHGSISEQRNKRKTAMWKEAWKNNPKTPFPSAVLWKKRSKNRSEKLWNKSSKKPHWRRDTRLQASTTIGIFCMILWPRTALSSGFFRSGLVAPILSTRCKRKCEKCFAPTHGSISEPRSKRKIAIWKQAWKSNLKEPFPSAVLWKKRTKNRS